MKTAETPLLTVADLRVDYPVRSSLLGRVTGSVQAVAGVSFTIAKGEAVGLVGESGCGKTTLGRALLRLVEPTAGRLALDGVDFTHLPAAPLRRLRRRMQMVFQDPFGTLNPRLTIGASIGEALDIHQLTPTHAARTARIGQLLTDVGLQPEQAQRYPHEFSGGQRQRIGIARALAVEPELIVADEPVSALDVSVQAQIVNLLADLQRSRGLTYLFISHDLAVVAHLCRRILVMYLGRLVETGPTDLICRDPLHPYTRALLSAVPEVGTGDPPPARIILGGDVPSPLRPPGGCAFHPRCPLAQARCRTEAPVLRPLQDGRQVACHLVTEP